MPVYAVTGASGHLGRLAVQQLLARGVLPSGIVAVVRSRATVGDFAARGVHVPRRTIPNLTHCAQRWPG
jgi:NAD(P)H dehydrogenase (quinone)